MRINWRLINARGNPTEFIAVPRWNISSPPQPRVFRPVAHPTSIALYFLYFDNLFLTLATRLLPTILLKDFINEHYRNTICYISLAKIPGWGALHYDGEAYFRNMWRIFLRNAKSTSQYISAKLVSQYTKIICGILYWLYFKTYFINLIETFYVSPLEIQLHLSIE